MEYECKLKYDEVTDEWKFITPNAKDIYKILKYDDGLQDYEHYINEWMIYGKWLGKCALVNYHNQSIKINSISRWKIMKK
jgi:hypothetical protein